MAEKHHPKTGTHTPKSEDVPDHKPQTSAEAEADESPVHLSPHATIAEACDAVLMSTLTPATKWVVRSLMKKGINLERLRQAFRVKGAPPLMQLGVEAYWHSLASLPPGDPKLEPGPEPE